MPFLVLCFSIPYWLTNTSNRGSVRCSSSYISEARSVSLPIQEHSTKLSIALSQNKHSYDIMVNSYFLVIVYHCIRIGVGFFWARRRY
jgi:hypothetical protein